MPRNASGVYTLPGGNPVTPGDVIEAEWANTTLEDVANELTNSLSRTGAGGMLAPFRIADGTITAPGMSFLNETNTGLYRSGAGSAWMAVLGVNVAQFSTVGLTIASAKSLTALGNASVGGTFAVGGATTLASTLAVTGALTATGGVLGNITAGSGTSTFNNVVINGDLDMSAGSSGTITNLPNPTNPGDAANKAYVDSQDALRLALTGGTMTGVIAMSNNKVTGLATPTADQDAANKAYVDSVAQGIDAKASCRAATTANITLSGTQTIDGVAVIAGDRVLVKNQSSAADNGIYVAAVSTWSRSADANTWDELVAAFTFVENGTENGNNGYICTIAPGGTLGVTAVTWAQFSGAGQIIAGQGLSKTGNTIQVNTASSARIVIGADEIDLATTGVVANTYKSVTVDQWGRVTAGTNPTTLAGFGIGDAYTQAQTDSLLAAKLSLAGGTMSGAIAMGGSKVTGMADPTLAQDAATKNYIDTIFGSTTSAAASAAAAATSASNAASSASSASTSASSASSSATSAAASATSAAASFDSFDDRYLGAKASDPTVDNDGNPLLTGALYWNTTVSQMRVYDGSAWVAAYLPVGSYMDLTTNQTAAGVKTFTDGAFIQGLTVGRGAGAVATNTAVGNSALASNTSGLANVAVGYSALNANTTGYYNIAVGRNSLIANTTADGNTALGDLTLTSNTTGASNVAVGRQALQANTTASYNTSVGYQSLYSNTTGAYNNAVGVSSLFSNTTGQFNTAIGNGAMTANTTGSYNVGLGHQSLQAGTTASNNTAVGYQAGFQATGGGNTFLGVTSGYQVTSGTNNVYVGNATGPNGGSASTASENVAVGTEACTFLTSGTRNTAIGRSALYSNTTASNNTAVGYQSLYANTTGAGVDAFGASALKANTTGTLNAAFGQASLTANTTGTNNLGAGFASLLSNTTGGANTALGVYALQANTTTSNNTAVGYQAGYSTNNGNNNTFIGYQAGYSNAGTGVVTAVGGQALYNSTQDYGTALGYRAGYANTTGKITAIGSYSLSANTTGTNNVAVGGNDGIYGAVLQSNTTGGYNTAIGYNALLSNTTASNNTAVGESSLFTNTTGSSNAALGNGALYLNTTGTSNVAIGQQALRGNTTASNNTAVGYQAFYSNTTAANNTAVGHQAGYSNQTGTRSVLVGGGAGYSSTALDGDTHVGFSAGYSQTTGFANTFVGSRSLNGSNQGAGNAVTTGTYNTFIGGSAGGLVTTGSKNTVLGNYTGNQGGLDIRTSSNFIVLSDGDGNPRMWINGSGNGIFSGEGSGTQRLFNIRKDGASEYAIKVSNETTTGGLIDFTGNGSGTRGSITHNGTSVAYNTTSDYRLKENAQPMTGALATVAALKPVTYNWKLDGSSGQGFIAHELAEVVPQCVTGGKDAVDGDGNPVYQGIDTSFLVATLTAAIQEQQAIIESLKARLDAANL